MSAATLPSQATRPHPSGASGINLAVGLALAFWLALVIVLGARNAFIQPSGAPPLPILLAVSTPVALFLMAYRTSKSFRDFVLTFDLRLAAGIQAWRFAGLGFIALYAHGILPGVFAWPAGVGDLAIGLTAPWVLLALIRKPEFAASRGFVIWNLLGLLDLAVAVGIGTLVASLVIAVPDGATTGVMARLPLLLIPGYVVPLFVMLHLTALVQARQLATARQVSVR